MFIFGIQLHLQKGQVRFRVIGTLSWQQKKNKKMRVIRI